MAARGMNLRYLLTAVILSLGAAAATFELKYSVRNLEHELASVRKEIARERWAVQNARADLAYLTRPERLVQQAGQLNMEPARGTRLVQVDQIPPWQQVQLAGMPVPTTLPSGTEVMLRLRPLPMLAVLGQGSD